MLGITVVVFASLAMWYAIHHFELNDKEDISSPKTSERLNRLWGYVDRAARQGRNRAIEKALLAILRIDHKNTAAYNRLGMVYAKQRNFDDAIDCFAIASSLTPTVATLYNLGLVYYEKGNYKEAATAFERVVDLEPNVKRYIAFAKALQKLDNLKQVTVTLEKVVALEPTAEHYEMLGQSYSQVKDFIKAEEARKQAAILKSKKIGTSASKTGRRSVSTTVERVVPKRMG
ncbi:tetratricopeptide repeat protein [Candidatus Microgenomates bacterium]|nr:tetratricopeptide repeat protein [Candidatus Microgenomates bacterium]